MPPPPAENLVLNEPTQILHSCQMTLIINNLPKNLNGQFYWDPQNLAM
jgi:hypothetical protein